MKDKHQSKSNTRILYRLLPGILTLTWALYESFRLRWLSDDAFISFRYAWNLVRGYGLVFNQGEYVEGFTNFLWTILISLGLSVDFPAESFSMVLSIGSLATLLILLLAGAIPWRRYRINLSNHASETEAPVNPETTTLLFYTLLILGGIHHMHVFATSGLETMSFTLSISLGTYFLWIAQKRKPGRALLFLTLACLLRPDGLIVLIIAYAYLATVALRSIVTDKQSHNSAQGILETNSSAGFSGGPGQYQSLVTAIRPILATGLFLLLYQSWRLYYYDSFFPNTFYAKSAYDPYPGQGLFYLILFYKSYWYLPLLLAVSIALQARHSRSSSWWMLLLVVIAWHLYVIWVGGDFMFARFLIPILPAQCALIAWALAGWIDRFNRGQNPPENSEKALSLERTGKHGTYLGLVLPILLLLLPAFRLDPYKILRQQNLIPEIQGVVEERYYYPRQEMEKLGRLARSYRPLVQSTGLRLAFHGGAAFLIYNLDPDYALEASTGLTDRTLARTILKDRGRIGHEKEATLEYMRERNVHIYMWPPEYHRLEQTIRFEGFWQDWQIVYHEDTVIQSLLAHPSVSQPYSNP